MLGCRGIDAGNSFAYPINGKGIEAADVTVVVLSGLTSTNSKGVHCSLGSSGSCLFNGLIDCCFDERDWLSGRSLSSEGLQSSRSLTCYCSCSNCCWSSALSPPF